MPCSRGLRVLLFVLVSRCHGLGCWDGRNGFTEERCCGAGGDDCWTKQLLHVGITKEICCDLSSDQAKLGGKLEFELVRAFTMAVGVLERLDGCRESVDILLQLLRNVPLLSAQQVVEWMSGSYAEDFCPSKIDPVSRLHYLLSSMEVILMKLQAKDGNSKAFASLVEEKAVLVHTALLRRSHAIWSRRAQTSIRTAAQLPHLLMRDDFRPMGQSYLVHIAMVASVGKPAFGAKALAGIRSALFFAKEKHLVFHLVVDDEGELDMLHVLNKLEWWLRARGTFEFHNVKSLRPTRQKIRDMVPKECLDGNRRYGTIGWVRLFPHEVLDKAVKSVIWVDAGDFIFLDDPAKVAAYLPNFSEEQVVAAPSSHALPFQFYDLEKIRRMDWSSVVKDVVEQGHRRHGNGFCELGEGGMVNAMISHAKYKRLWYWMPSIWSFEPWSDWLPGHGVLDLWSNRGKNGQGYPNVWRSRIHPGLDSFISMRVHCPQFLTSFITAVIGGWTDSQADIASGLLRATTSHVQDRQNETFGDNKGQELRCNEKVRGVHFVLPFHRVPWVHRVLNFWAGGNVWRDHQLAEEQRDLSGA